MKKDYFKPELLVEELSLTDVLGLSGTDFDDTFIDGDNIVG